MPQTTDPKQPRHRTVVPPVRERPAIPTRAVAGNATTPGDPSPPGAPADPRSRWIGLAVIGAAAVIAFIVTVGIFLPALGALTSGGIVTQADPRALPAQILVCGREYGPSAEPVERTLEEVRLRDGRDPTLVSAVPDAGCPTGVCVEGGLCLPVVYVRTPSERYIEYELQEGA
jgi:hypothetical protein